MKLNRIVTLPRILLLIMLLAACVLRFWQVTQIPHTLWVDEAWFALRARDIVRGIDFVPITRPGLGVGDAPMQVYLAAAVQLLGFPAPYSPRIASSIVGVLTIALMYPTLMTIWKEEYRKENARWMALIGTSIMTALFAHVYASRMGSQYALSAAFTVATMWLSWKALSGPHLAWSIGAGLVLGLSQYTYESARALPILVGAFGLVRIGQADTENRKQIIKHLGIIVGAAILAFAPLIVVYIRDPSVYVLHMQDVAKGVLSGQPSAVFVKVLKNYVRVLGGISVQGDIMPGRNLVGRPMLDPFLSLFCWLGVILAATRIRKSRSSQLLILWIAIMLLPSALSDQAPASNRMLVVAPALTALASVGMTWTLRQVNQWLPNTNRWLFRRTPAILLAVMLIASQAKSVYDYFARWAQDPRLFDALAMGPRLVADRAIELAETHQVYLTPVSDPFIEPVYNLVLEDSSIKTLDGNTCSPLVDHPTQTVDYGVVTVSDHNTLPRLKSIYPDGHEFDFVAHPDGYAYAVFFRVPAGTPGPVPQYQVRAEFADGPTLVGYDLSASSVKSGDSIRLVLHWLATNSRMEDLVSFVHIGKGRHSDPLVANHDAQICGHSYPTSRWSAGELLLDVHNLTVADDAPSDTYEIAVGVYRASDQMRLEIVQSTHQVQDNRVTIGTLTVLH